MPERNRLAGILTALLFVGFALPMNGDTLQDQSGTGKAREDAQIASGGKATTPGGMTVELFAIAVAEASGWWKPDGSPLLQPKLNEFVPWSMLDKAKYRQCVFMFRLAPTTRGFTTFQAKDAESSSLMYFDTSLDRKANKHDALFVLAALPVDASKTTLRVGVTAGAWTTTAEVTGKGTGMDYPLLKHATGLANGGVIFSPISSLKGEAACTVSDTALNRDDRVIAIDTKGRTVVGTSAQSLSVNSVRQNTVTFPGLLPKNVKRVQFQTRPYEWIEFRDIPLRPLQSASR